MHISTNAKLLLAERFLRSGFLHAAINILTENHIETNPVQAFIACGDLCMENASKVVDGEDAEAANGQKYSLYQDAMEAYKRAGATWKLIELADMYSSPKRSLTDSELDVAFGAYSAANAGPKIQELGYRALKSRAYTMAYECFEATADRDGLMQVAKQSRDVEIVIKAYTKAEARQELIDTGLRLLERFRELKDNEITTNPISQAKEAFEGAGALEYLSRCGDAYLTLAFTRQYQTQAIGWAIQSYQAAKATLPTEKLLEVVDYYLQQNWVKDDSISERACQILCDAGVLPASLL